MHSTITIIFIILFTTSVFAEIIKPKPDIKPGKLFQPVIITNEK